MKTMYRILQYNEDHIPEILATGECKADAESALMYDGLEINKVNWRNYPTERFDPLGGGFITIYDGIYNG